MVSESRFVGLDAGRAGIEAAVRPTGETLRTETCDEGMTEIAESITKLQPQLVVLQANGNFELPLAGILVTFKLPVALVQPRNVRDFARAIGRLSRVEQHQAGLLAQFAEFVQPEVSILPDEQIEELKQLRRRRKEVLEMIALERSRVGSTVPGLEKDIQSHIQFLERCVMSIDAQFSRRVRVSRMWH
jgi:transposase